MSGSLRARARLFADVPLPRVPGAASPVSGLLTDMPSSVFGGAPVAGNCAVVVPSSGKVVFYLRGPPHSTGKRVLVELPFIRDSFTLLVNPSST